MSKSNSFLILDSGENEMPPKTIKMARRKLRDISNLQHAQRTLIQDGNSQSIPETANDYIEQLRKENLVLVKAIAHRNVIIQQSEIELQKLKLNLDRLQAENRELALSHSQMLSELNFGKDQVKVLCHEVNCKDALLRLRKPETEHLIGLKAKGGSSKCGVAKVKPRKGKRKRPQSRSVCLSASLESDHENGTVSINVRCVKQKRPNKLKDEESEDNNNPEIAAAEDPQIPTSLSSESTRDEATKAGCTSEPSQSAATTSSDSEGVSFTRSHSEEGEVQDSGTRLSSRPSRAAAKRIQSYKEKPINVKMRRQE